MGTLSGNVISTSYKKLVFTNATSGNEGNLFYTLDADGTTDTALTTLTSPMTFSGLITASAGIKLGNNIIYASDGGTAIKLDTSDNVAITGDLVVTGNDIRTGTIESPTTAMTMAGANVTIAGDLTITGGNITNAITCDSSLTTTGLLTANANVVVGADADGTDRSIIFGHSTLKTIMGIDDDQDVFAINTDGDFEAANDFELDTNGNVTIKGDLTISGSNITNALTLDSTLNVSDNTTIDGNLTFTGARDILFTEGDGLEIRDNNSLYVSMISNTMAITPPTTFSGKVLLNGNTGLTAGTGITDASGETYKSWVERCGGMIKTSIYLDVETLRANGDAKVIGKDGTSNPCHIGQITTAVCGTIVGGRMTCIEAPAGHATIDDIDLHFDNESTHAESNSLSSSTALITNTEAWTAGMTKTFGTVITADNYLYLITGENATDTEYTAGKFLIEIWGTA